MAIEFAEARVTSELENASATKDAEIERLKEELKSNEAAKSAALDLAEASLLNELQKAATPKDAEIQALKAKLDASGVAEQLAISQAVGVVEKERDGLKRGLERVELEN